MSDCCATSGESENENENESKPKTLKRECPACHQLCLNVQTKTILHHLKEAWNYDLSDENYFYCRTKSCDVVYFSNDGNGNEKTLLKTDLRTAIGIKEQDDNTLICYCFGINKAEAVTDKKIKDFVIAQTKESNCTCETTNPSGRCCLKDFPKFK